MTTVHDFTVDTPDGSKNLADYDGTALLIVNVASKCGLTPQYAGLEELYREAKDRGLEILGFPCNQFGGQEPGTSEEIAEFCSVNYDVSFPLLSKIDVNGPDADPLFEYLRAETGGADIAWNFGKFLIGRDGSVVKRFEPQSTPAQLRADVDAVLSA